MVETWLKLERVQHGDQVLVDLLPGVGSPQEVHVAVVSDRVWRELHLGEQLSQVPLSAQRVIGAVVDARRWSAVPTFPGGIRAR